jgi:ABC-2 type transport system permease protein
VFFRDMQYLWTVLSQLLLYLSAVFYPIDTFPPAMQAAFMANPIFDFITYFRQVVIDGIIPSPELHALLAAFAFGTVAIGGLIYRKYNTEFLYYV